MHLLGVYKRERERERERQTDRQRERESFYIKFYTGGIRDIKIRSDVP